MSATSSWNAPSEACYITIDYADIIVRDALGFELEDEAENIKATVCEDEKGAIPLDFLERDCTVNNEL